VQVPVLAPHELASESRCFPLDVLRQPGRSDPNMTTTLATMAVA
jgi:hypothetical protein